MLGGGVAGLSVARHARVPASSCADQRLATLGLPKRYGAKNPFGFMELQDVQELANFFERRVSAYQVGVGRRGRPSTKSSDLTGSGLTADDRGQHSVHTGDAVRWGMHGSATIDVEIGCTFEFDSPRPTHAIVMVEPHFSEAGRVVERRFELDPPSPTSVYHDHFGNTCRRVDLAAGKVAADVRCAGHGRRRARPGGVGRRRGRRRGAPRRGADVRPAEPVLRVGRARRRGLPAVRPTSSPAGRGSRRSATG